MPLPTKLRESFLLLVPVFLLFLHGQCSGLSPASL